MMDIHYVEKGTGRPLILIHGFCETNEIWQPLADSLSQRFNVIMPDLPGFGLSQLPENGFSIKDVGSLILEWSRQWHTAQPVVIGHSLGGYVALAMAAEAPGAFGGLGLFHSTAVADTEEKKKNRDKVVAFVERHGVQAYTDTFVPGLFYHHDDPSIDGVRTSAALTHQHTLTGYALAMRDRPSALETVKRFLNPVLFVAGEHDVLVTPEKLFEQSKMARHGVFHSLEGSGHMGMLENEPASSNLVGNFMDFTENFPH